MVCCTDKVSVFADRWRIDLEARMRTRFILMATCVLVFGFGGKVVADDIVIGPGETLTLEEDLYLTGDDFLIINGAEDNPSMLDGGSYTIYTDGTWTGGIYIQYCRIQDLGTLSTEDGPGAPAFQLTVYGNGEVIIANSTFDGCNQFLVTTKDDSSVTLRNNVWQANGTFLVDKSPY